MKKKCINHQFYYPVAIDVYFTRPNIGKWWDW